MKLIRSNTPVSVLCKVSFHLQKRPFLIWTYLCGWTSGTELYLQIVNNKSLLHLLNLLLCLAAPPCRCGRLWAGASGVASCQRATPTSRGTWRRSGCSATCSAPSRWDASWRTSCSCQEGSVCGFTSGDTSSACRQTKVLLWDNRLRFLHVYRFLTVKTLSCNMIYKSPDVNTELEVLLHDDYCSIRNLHQVFTHCPGYYGNELNCSIHYVWTLEHSDSHDFQAEGCFRRQPHYYTVLLQLIPVAMVTPGVHFSEGHLRLWWRQWMSVWTLNVSLTVLLSSALRRLYETHSEFSGQLLLTFHENLLDEWTEHELNHRRVKSSWLCL